MISGLEVGVVGPTLAGPFTDVGLGVASTGLNTDPHTRSHGVRRERLDRSGGHSGTISEGPWVGAILGVVARRLEELHLVALA